MVREMLEAGGSMNRRQQAKDESDADYRGGAGWGGGEMKRADGQPPVSRRSRRRSWEAAMRARELMASSA